MNVVHLNYNFYHTSVELQEGDTVLTVLARYTERDKDKLEKDIVASEVRGLLTVFSWDCPHGKWYDVVRNDNVAALTRVLRAGDHIWYFPPIDTTAPHYLEREQKLQEKYGDYRAPLPLGDSFGLINDEVSREEVTT